MNHMPELIKKNSSQQLWLPLEIKFGSTLAESKDSPCER